MVSDDERREVARKLRKCTPPTSYRQSQGGGWAHLCDMALAVGFKREDNPTAWEFAQRLADLIDPTCLARADVEDTPDGGQFECWSCSVCGNIVSVDPDYDTETDGPAYCEACGHRIVGKGEPTWL